MWKSKYYENQKKSNIYGKRILNAFFPVDAFLALNLEARNRDKALAKLELDNIPIEVFDVALEDAYATLHRDTLPRLRRTEVFKAWRASTMV